MKNILFAILAFLFVSCSLAQAQEVTQFKWDPITTNIDGSPVTDVISYRIYCSSEPAVDVGSVLSVPINLSGIDGKYICTLTGYYVLTGDESPHSNTVIIVKQLGKYFTGGTLNAPSNFRVE